MALRKCKECGKEVSSKAKECPNCGAPVRKKVGGCGGCLTIIVVGIVAAIAIPNFLSYRERSQSVTVPKPPGQQRPKPEVARPPVAAQKGVDLPKYTILDEEISDIPLKTQVSLKVLVSGTISDGSLRALLQNLYSTYSTKTGFKYHNSPTNIYIYLFTSKERADSDMQWIGMLAKSPMYDVPDIRINERQIAQLGKKPEVKFGLTEDKRKQIWKEMVKAEDRAWAEADKRYPPKVEHSKAVFMEQLGKHSDLNDKLTDKYYDEIARKYGLTREQLNDIAVEGGTKDWPLPK